METLGHRAKLRRHEARGLRSGKPEGVDILVDVQPQNLADRGSCRKGAGQTARMEAAMKCTRADSVSNACAELIADRRSEDNLLAIEATEAFGRRHDRWNNTSAIMGHRLIMTIVELESLRGRAINKCCAQGVSAEFHAPGACRLRLAESLHHPCDRLAPRLRRTVHA